MLKGPSRRRGLRTCLPLRLRPSDPLSRPSAPLSLGAAPASGGHGARRRRGRRKRRGRGAGLGLGLGLGISVGVGVGARPGASVAAPLASARGRSAGGPGQRARVDRAHSGPGRKSPSIVLRPGARRGRPGPRTPARGSSRTPRPAGTRPPLLPSELRLATPRLYDKSREEDDAVTLVVLPPPVARPRPRQGPARRRLAAPGCPLQRRAPAARRIRTSVTGGPHPHPRLRNPGPPPDQGAPQGRRPSPASTGPPDLSAAPVPPPPTGISCLEDTTPRLLGVGHRGCWDS